MIRIVDVLKRPMFQAAHIVAGTDGLDRPVAWIHVGEIPNLGDFLRGEELVLATGVVLTDHRIRIQYLQGIIQAHASGLVLELGGYLQTVPDDMIAMANQCHFPIIAFSGTVRFLEISQDINTLLISQHHRILDELEDLSLKIRQALLNTEGAEKLLNLLSECTHRPTAYYPRDASDAIIVGSWAVEASLTLEPALHPEPWGSPPCALRQTVMVFGRPVGDLFVSFTEESVDERLYLALDRTTAALAQDYIRAESLDRTRRREEAALLEGLLFEESPDHYRCQRFRTRYHLSHDRGFRVGIIKARDAGTNPRVALAQLFHPTLTMVEYGQSDELIVVLVGSMRLLTSLSTMLKDQASHPRQLVMGFSFPYQEPVDMRQALAEAHDALLVAQYQGLAWAGYDTIGIWRWILYTPRAQLQHLLIDPELTKVITHPDAPRLLDTLEALVVHCDSRQSASQVLGIHRQTLYARIRSLTELIGPDFLEPPRRLALQSAITAFRYLQYTETHSSRTQLSP